MTSNSILSSQVRLLAEPLSTFFQGVLASCSNMSISDEISYFKKVSILDDNLQNIIDSCAIIGAESPLSSLEIFSEAVPKIDINSLKAPETNRHFTYISRLQKVNWESHEHRLVIYFLTDLITSYFLSRLCEKIVNPSKSDLKCLYDIIISNVVDPNLDKHLLQIHEINAHYYSQTVSRISKFIPDLVFDYIKATFLNSEKLCNNQAFVYLLFSDVSIRVSKLDEVKPLLQALLEIYKSTQTKSTLENLGLFLFNLLGQSFQMIEELKADEIIFEIYEASKRWITSKVLNVHALEIMTIINNFADFKFVLKPLQYTNTFIIPQICTKHEVNHQVLNSLLTLIRGPHYQSKSVLRQTKEQFKWHFIGEIKTLHEIFGSIIGHIDLFCEDQETLADIITQVAANDFKDFVQDTNEKLCVPQTFARCKAALFRAYITMICPNSNFSRYAKNYSDEVMTKFITTASILCNNELMPVAKPTMRCQYVNPPSFTTVLHNKFTFEDQSKGSVLKLITEYSIASTPQNASVKYFNKQLTRWKKIFGNVRKEAQWPYKTDKEKLQLATITTDDSSLPVILLKLVPMALDNINLISHVCGLVVAESPGTSAMAIATLQAAIHLKGELAHQIITMINTFYCQSKLTSPSLFTLINALKCIMDTVRSENIKLNAESVNIIQKFGVLGLFHHIYEVRTVAFQLLQLCPIIDGFSVYNIISKKENLICTEAKANALLVHFPGMDEEIAMADDILFEDMIRGSCLSLLPFWIASLGKAIAQTSNQFIEPVHRFLAEILTSEKGLSENPNFAINAAAFFFAISIGGTASEEVGPIVKRAEKIANLMDDRAGYLCAAVSCANGAILESLISEVSNRRVQMYLLKQASKDPSYVACQTAKRLTPSLDNVLKKTTNDMFRMGIVEEKEDSYIFSFNKERISEYSLQCSIADFSKAISQILEYVAGLQKREVHGPFPRVVSSMLVDNHPAATDSVFRVFFALSSAPPEFPFSNYAKDALAALCRVSDIPDQMYNFLKAHLAEIRHPQLAATVLARHPTEGLPMYLVGARKDFTFFKAIADQLAPADGFMDSWKTSISKTKDSGFSVDEMIFGESIYRNAGSILAIAMYYIVGNTAEIRETAFNVIFNIAMSISLMCYPSESTKILFEGLKKLNGAFKSDMSAYIHSDAIALCSILCERIPIIGEQFVEECIILDKIEPPKPQPISTVSSKTTDGPEIDSHKLATGDLVPNATASKALTISTFALEQSAETKRTLMAEYIVPWMKQFVFQPETNRIFEMTGNVFVRFSVTSFVDMLLGMSTSSVSPPIQSIFKSIAFSHPPQSLDLVLLILTRSIIFQNDQEASSRELLLFLYTVDPEAVLKHFIAYTDFGAWHYYEIQISKLDQLFNFEQYMSDISPKSTSNNGEDEQIEDILDYDSAIKFVLGTIADFVKEDARPLEPYKNNLLAFLFMNYHLAPDEVESVLNITTGMTLGKKQHQQYAKKQRIVGVGCFSFDALCAKFADLSVDSKGHLVDYLRPWAFSCGDIESATVACVLLDSLITELSDNDVKLLCQALMVVSTALTEKSTPSLRKAQESVLLRMCASSREEPLWDGMYSYLERGLHLLKKTPNPSSLLILFVAQFLKCQVTDYSSIFDSAANTLLHFLKIPEAADQISKFPCYGKDFIGIAPWIFAAKQTEHGFKLASDLLKVCVKAGLWDFLWRVNKFAFALVFLPILVGKESSDIIKPLTDMLDDIRLNTALDACSREGIVEPHFQNVIKIVLDQQSVDKETVDQMFKWLCCVQANGSITQKMAVYEIISAAAAGYESKIDFNSLPIGTIARDAVHERTPLLQKPIMNLLQRLMRENSGNINVPPSRAPLPMFPQINDILSLRVREWKPTDGDLAPLYITDFGFVACAIFAELRAAVEQVHSEPFTSWAENVYKAQSAKLLLGIEENDNSYEIKNAGELKEIADRFERLSAPQVVEAPEEEGGLEEPMLPTVPVTAFAQDPEEFRSLLADINLSDFPSVM